MKPSHECTERELLIRIDERTKDLPAIRGTQQKHTISIVTLTVVMAFVLVKTYPMILEALAR